MRPTGLIQRGLVVLVGFFLCPHVIILQAAAANDTLLQGQSIRDDGRPLVSAKQEFALGFFSPANTTNRYVGIWYHTIPGGDVVWVANRDRPITDRSGTFTLLADGTLVVTDLQRNTTLWSSSNATGRPATPANGRVSAQLLDTGNFVVTNGSSSGNTVWQMFDHPADTLLPGMRVGLDLTTRVLRGWTPWSSPQDPSPGPFLSAVDYRGLAQAVVWETSPNGTLGRPRWRSGQWNGVSFTGVWNMKPFNTYGLRFGDTAREKKLYYTYTPFNDETYVRLVVMPGGTVTQYNWTRGVGDGKWLTFWEQPLTACEVYNACGSNAVCMEDPERRPMQQWPASCECWKGFQPREPEEWRRGERGSGCVRRTAVACNSSVEGRDYGFWKMSGLKLPDLSVWVADLDADGCKAACRRNCSCTAYAFVSGIGCMTWGGNLDDVHTMPGTGPGSGNDVFLKLAQSELLDAGESRKKPSNAYLVGVVLGPLVIVMGVLVLISKCRSRRRALLKNKERKIDFCVWNVDKEQKQGDMADLPLFSFEEIVSATNKFSEYNLLGKGGFGPVYKGMITGGQEVAVKRLSKDSGQGVEQFKNEVLLIAQLQHRNLVRLLGCCVQEDEKILVYEFMPNKSLDVFLFVPKNQALLDWKMRFDVIEGIARGLLYLHHDSRLRIVHRDLKASNILLDSEMRPKISDFGMARIFGGNQNQGNTNRVVGTYGYMAPEYAMDGLFSVKSDVYSFGVLVLEIVSGRKNQFALDHGPFSNLLGQAWQMWDEGRALELVDPAVGSSLRPMEALKCINIGLLCVQDRAGDRPTMPTVLVMLGSENISCPAPKQPIFTTERSHDASDSSTSRSHGSASTDVTITVITGR